MRYAIKKSELVALVRKDRSNKLLVVIGGPTGVGKTAMAIQLAKHFQTEIVSADSRQVYKELHIGVGKPTDEQLKTVPHHLISCTSIQTHYSVGHFLKDALPVIEDLFKNHDIVILTGGTGLYVKAIMEGMDEIPDIPIEVVTYWTAIWKEKGIEALIHELEKRDPAYLAEVDQSNPMRLIRAVAVSAYTGSPFSSFRKRAPVSRPFHILPVVLDLPREELYRRIDQRVLEMIDSGWMEEAKSLYPFRHLKALHTVGYPELYEVIDHKLTLPEAINRIQQATRRYAKRQLTWWRHQGQWHSFSPDQVDSIIEAIEHEAASMEHGA